MWFNELKVLATKPVHLSSKPQTHVVEGKSQLQVVLCLLHIHTDTETHKAHTHPHTHNKVPWFRNTYHSWSSKLGARVIVIGRPQELSSLVSGIWLAPVIRDTAIRS